MSATKVIPFIDYCEMLSYNKRVLPKESAGHGIVLIPRIEKHINAETYNGCYATANTLGLCEIIDQDK